MKWNTKSWRVGCAVLALASLTACDLQDMYEQPKNEPLQRSPFFGDERSARPLEPDTVARGELRTNAAWFTGRSGTNLVTVVPVPVTAALLRRGEERYTIFCAPCHDRTGEGHGMIVQRGFRKPPSFHIPRLRTAPVGHFFDVMTTGFGTMPDYAAPIRPEDRWAIAAYIRALQYRECASLADVPPPERQKLEALPP